MRSTLKIGLISFTVRARRNKVRQCTGAARRAPTQAGCGIVTAVPLPLIISLCTFGFTIVSTHTNAAELGRLFFTPEQRRQLDYAYANSSAGRDGSASVMVINGIVQKQGGARTVWINGVARHVGSSDERAPESQTIIVPGKAQAVKAKVGQKILLGQPAPDDEKKSGP